MNNLQKNDQILKTRDGNIMILKFGLREKAESPISQIDESLKVKTSPDNIGILFCLMTESCVQL